MRTLAGALIVAAGCASAPIRPADQLRLADADAKVLEGCYDCLLEARDTFRQLATARARPLVVSRLFEVQVLIGLRERELAMDASHSFTEAEALLPELPPAAEGALVLELARIIPPDPAGVTRASVRDGEPGLRAWARGLAPLRERLALATLSAPFRDYVDRGVACAAASVGVRQGDSPAAETTAPALLKYRYSLCPAFRPDPLGEVGSAVPRFVEALLYRSRRPTITFTANFMREQREWITAAYQRFPKSPSATYALGALHQVAGDCRSALRLYDETLALVPAHETAALQRVVCLGVIGEYEAAIAGATAIIDAQYFNRAEAYYWRSWGHYRLKHLTEARADIDRALALELTARSFALGGFIKHDQKEYDEAEHNLKAALDMDRTVCLARWYLGLVAFARENWQEVGEAFGRSAACYRTAADESTARLAAVEAGDLDPDFKAAQIAGLQTAIREDRTQEQASYLNAANGFVQSKQLPRAAEMLALVPDDSPHAPAARELRTYIAAVNTSGQ
jgi:tetratricopeptide (TPR) repeat protein